MMITLLYVTSLLWLLPHGGPCLGHLVQPLGPLEDGVDDLVLFLVVVVVVVVELVLVLLVSISISISSSISISIST